MILLFDAINYSKRIRGNIFVRMLEDRFEIEVASFDKFIDSIECKEDILRFIEFIKFCNQLIVNEFYQRFTSTHQSLDRFTGIIRKIIYISKKLEYLAVSLFDLFILENLERIANLLDQFRDYVKKVRISIAKVSLYFVSEILRSIMFPYIIYCLRPEDFNSIDERIQRVFKHGDIMLKYSPHDEYIIYISYEIKNKCGDVYDFGNLAFNLKPLVLDSVPLKNILTKILRNVLRNKNEFESKLPQYIEY